MTREEAIEILKGMKYPYNYKKKKRQRTFCRNCGAKMESEDKE